MNKNDCKQISIKNSLWGGRFESGPSTIMQHINNSIYIDHRLYSQDLACSKAHAKMLSEQQLIGTEEEKKIQEGLKKIKIDIENGEFNFREDLEDIHMNIESALTELIGDAGARLHTARSRNDQVATDFRLWIREHIDIVDEALKRLQACFIEKAKENLETILPGFTHLQTAQPISFAHHCMAYVEMFGRDRERFKDCQKRLNECPLGAAALAGTSFPINRERTAELLGFREPCANSLDAVSARDFVVEYLSHAAICSLHLSRLCEEIVLWSTSQFDFIRLSDDWTTGSSIMPQKKNPDAAELIRAKSGHIMGTLIQLMTIIKALPLAYSKDLQDDKAPCFAATDTLLLSLEATIGMIENMTVKPENMLEAASKGFSTATDLADWLVKDLKIPFRFAHHITGQIVKVAESQNIDISELSIEEMQKIHPDIHKGVYSVLTVRNSVFSRKSFGGTSPDVIKKAIKQAEKKYLT